MEAISWSDLSNPGRFRKNNEDAFLAVRLNGPQFNSLERKGAAPMRVNSRQPDSSGFYYSTPTGKLSPRSDGIGTGLSGFFTGRYLKRLTVK
tara:strand:- start:1716 stop:1991 length:276 start_codon:yes stop_codon:yes gene_type:complete